MPQEEYMVEDVGPGLWMMLYAMGVAIQKLDAKIVLSYHNFAQANK